MQKGQGCERREGCIREQAAKIESGGPASILWAKLADTIPTESKRTADKGESITRLLAYTLAYVGRRRMG